jgi:hypothetical protein
MSKILCPSGSNTQSVMSEQSCDATNSVATGLRDVGHDLETLLDAVKSQMDAHRGDARLQMIEICVRNVLCEVERLIVCAEALTERLGLHNKADEEV